MREARQIVFMGSDAIALPALRLLAEEEQLQLAGVFTQPDRPSGRGKRLQANPIKEWATSNGMEILEPEKPGEVEAAWLIKNKISFGIVMAYGHLLGPSLLEAVDGQLYNLHASLLPAYRGASPVETALAEGEESTGVSLMRIVSKMDAGPLVDREAVAILENEDGPSLREKLSSACLPLLKRNLADLLAGQTKEEPQEESSVTYCRLLRKEDGRLDFSMSACRLARRVAALRAWPGCFFEFGGIRIKVGSARVATRSVDAAPGEVLGERGDALALAVGDGVLELLELQRPGGKMLSAPDFLRGFSLEPGTRLEIRLASPLVASSAGFYPKNEKTD